MRIINRGASKLKLGDWVLGRGFDANQWNTGLPTAADLDRAVPAAPALIHSRDAHTAWLNTAALRRCGITRNTPDPTGGRYLRDVHGAPTGIVQETAVEQLPNPLRDLALRTDAEAERTIDRALAAGYREAWRHGIVGVHAMDDGPSLRHLARHRVQGKLGLRVVHAVPLADWRAATALSLRSGLGDEWLRIGGVKIFSDGALGSQTAYMFDAYPGQPDFRGVPVHAGAELAETVAVLTRHGWAAWVHAIGDRAVHETAAAIAGARRCGRPALPHRIEHAQCVRPRDVRRMAAAGIIASVQPCHILGDIVTADRHWPGARRHAYPLRRMRRAGVTLAAGSDIPVEQIDPRRSFHGACVRADAAGSPADGWFPEERLAAREVLDAFTRGAALAGGADEHGGVLRVGAPADLTLWGADPLQVDARDLLHIPILGCVVGGQPHLNDDR